MNKKQAHFEALGYEPLRMKPAHFAAGFFISLTDEVYANELLNKVAVTTATKGLIGDYTPEAVIERLRSDGLIADEMTQADVELLRVQVNGVVDNDAAMFPAFKPYRPKGNDYTFISPLLLTKASRTDGYAGHFVATVLASTQEGKTVIDFARKVAAEPPGTLQRFIKPLLGDVEGESSGLAQKYDSDYGKLSEERIGEVAGKMRVQTAALARLCENLPDYSHYRRIQYLVLGLLAWLMGHLLKTASVRTANPLFLFDFTGEKDGPIRSQSQACYARLRETVRRTYLDLAAADRFSSNPLEDGLFRRRNGEYDFRFLEEHFRDFAVRMGYVQPRASNVSQKHFELQPDTLRVLMLSILDRDSANAITFEEVCLRLKDTWGMVVGGAVTESEKLQQQGHFGFDEADLQRNADAFADRLKGLNLAIEPSDGLVLCSRDIGGVL